MKKQTLFLSTLCILGLISGCLTVKTPDTNKTIVMTPGETKHFQVTASNLTGYKCEKSWSIIDTAINDGEPSQTHEESHMQRSANGMEESIAYTPDASSYGWYKVIFTQKYFPESHVSGNDTDEVIRLRETATWDVLVWNDRIGEIVISDISYGVSSNQVGVINAGEGAFQAPETFALDETGNAYICDALNGRIQIFSPDGEYLNTLPLPKAADGELSIAVLNGFVYVYSKNEANEEKLYQLSLVGTLQSSISIDNTRWSQYNAVYYKPLHIINGEVYLCVKTINGGSQIDGDVLIAKVKEGKLVSPSVDELQTQVEEGILAEDGHRYPRYSSENEEFFTFIGLDSANNRFFSKYAWIDGVSTRQVLIYDSHGNLTHAVTTPGGDYPFGTAKTVDVTKNGVIVQMMPGATRMYLCFFTVH